MDFPDKVPRTSIIKPSSGWQFIDVRELWAHRDLMFFMFWRDLKGRYAQSVLGFSWAVLQPAVFMIVFTIIFGKIARISSDGVPYAIFSYTALAPWTLFSNSIGSSAQSLAANQALLTKVYFPRVIMPLVGPLARLPDFLISLSLLAVLMVWFGKVPSIWILALPALVLIIFVTAVGMGLWLSALSIQYRDVRYALPMAIQLGLYITPVVYPASLVPERYLLFYSLNPMVGVVEGFRAALLGTRDMPFDMLAVGIVTSVVVAVSGIFVFNRMERNFADVI